MSGTRCDHGMRWGGHLVACTQDLGHDGKHSGQFLPDSPTIVSWLPGDRRDFSGGDPGPCPEKVHLPGPCPPSGPHMAACILPAGHHGRHES